MPALLPIAGQTLVEYQVRTARACGCGHIVVLVDHLPAGLVAAFDRLRADGIDVEVARDCRDAADRIHPDEQLLLVTSGLVASRRVLEALVRQATPTLSTARLDLAASHYERVDASDSWTGLALLNGQILRQTVAALGDWSLGSTLLRSALQCGARRLPLDHLSELAMVKTVAQANAISENLISQSSNLASRGLERWTTQPIARLIAPYVISRNLPFDLQIVLASVALGVSLVFALLGWFIAGFLMLLIATFADAVAQISANVSARASRTMRIFQDLKLPTLSAMLLALGFAASSSNTDWTPIILALWATSALLLNQRVDPAALQPWSPTLESCILVMVIFLLVGAPVLGLAVIVAHSIADQLRIRLFADKN